jgi:hypothetical protein
MSKQHGRNSAPPTFSNPFSSGDTGLSGHNQAGYHISPKSNVANEAFRSQGSDEAKDASAMQPPSTLTEGQNIHAGKHVDALGVQLTPAIGYAQDDHEGTVAQAA